MSVAFEYICRNYIRNHEFHLLGGKAELENPTQLLLSTPYADTTLFMSKSFRLRMFLLFSHKWLIRYTILGGDLDRTENTRMILPLRTRRRLRRTSELLDRKVKWRGTQLMAKISHLPESCQLRLVNQLGAFDIFISDHVDLLLRLPRFKKKTKDILSLEILSFQQFALTYQFFGYLGQLVKFNFQEFEDNKQLLNDYLSLKYGYFIYSTKMDIHLLEREVETGFQKPISSIETENLPLESLNDLMGSIQDVSTGLEFAKNSISKFGPDQ